MSYIVRALIKDRAKIYTSIITKDPLTDTVEIDLENDEYDDLLTIERKIKELYEAGIISTIELEVLNEFALNKTPTVIAREREVDRKVIINIFYNVTNRIAYALGGSYTDAGYTEYMIKKYKLNEEQTKKLIDAMKKGI